MKQFSEATRVQMPAMVHLTRIGYTCHGKLSEDKNGRECKLNCVCKEPQIRNL